ncbi:hypothetical protein GCM10008110_19120 [Marinobacter persicus]|nr:hypothetical protein GCM10008110_19120 [Marinobacter persicus]
MLAQLRHYQTANLLAPGPGNTVLAEHIGNGLRFGIAISFQQGSDLTGTGLLSGVCVLFIPPDGNCHEDYKNTDNKEFCHLS